MNHRVPRKFSAQSISAHEAQESAEKMPPIGVEGCAADGEAHAAMDLEAPAFNGDVHPQNQDPQGVRMYQRACVG